MKRLLLCLSVVMNASFFSCLFAEETQDLRSRFELLRESVGVGRSATVENSDGGAWVSSKPLRTELEKQVYYLGCGDVLEITVLSLKEFERKGISGDELDFIINDQGMVNVPLVGLVKADGLTTEELTGDLVESFKKFVTVPQVSVVVKHYRSKLVHVLGKVFNNGAIPLRHEGTSLFEVIAEAGGFSAKMPSVEGVMLNAPDMRNIFVIRNNHKYVVNIYDRLTNLTDDEPFIMQAGDKIFVPEPLETVSVLGGVRRAGSFEVKSGLTLLQAVALAGSFTEQARRDQVRVVRKGEADVIRLNALNIIQGRETDPLLQAGDVIYVAEW
jgi:polysaccharide export outer membrane protein